MFHSLQLKSNSICRLNYRNCCLSTFLFPLRLAPPLPMLSLFYLFLSNCTVVCKIFTFYRMATNEFCGRYETSLMHLHPALKLWSTVSDEQCKIIPYTRKYTRYVTVLDKFFGFMGFSLLFSAWAVKTSHSITSISTQNGIPCSENLQFSILSALTACLLDQYRAMWINVLYTTDPQLIDKQLEGIFNGMPSLAKPKKANHKTGGKFHFPAFIFISALAQVWSDRSKMHTEVHWHATPRILIICNYNRLLALTLPKQPAESKIHI